MTKDDLKPGMILKLSAGKGTYEDDLWASLIRVVSVNRSKDRAWGLQYMTLAVRNKNCPTHLGYQKSNPIINMSHDIDEWWATFDIKIVV